MFLAVYQVKVPVWCFLYIFIQLTPLVFLLESLVRQSDPVYTSFSAIMWIFYAHGGNLYSSFLVHYAVAVMLPCGV